jgi:hypothetical protein
VAKDEDGKRATIGGRRSKAKRLSEEKPLAEYACS